MGVDIGLRQLAVAGVKNPQGKEISRQLQQFIKYKAELAGIKVEYINPKHTSQSCSKCKKIKKSNRRANLYSFECGNHIHADLNAGRNIANKYLEQQSA